MRRVASSQCGFGLRCEAASRNSSSSSVATAPASINEEDSLSSSDAECEREVRSYSSAWGQFSDSAPAPGNSETQLSAVEQVKKWHQDSAKKASPANPGCKVIFRAHNSAMVLSFRCFGGLPFCWGLGGFRIVVSARGTSAASIQDFNHFLAALKLLLLHHGFQLCIMQFSCFNLVMYAHSRSTATNLNASMYYLLS
jgi:hypothetical protein